MQHPYTSSPTGLGDGYCDDGTDEDDGSGNCAQVGNIACFLETIAEPDEVLFRQSTATFSYATTAIVETPALSSKVRILICSAAA